MTGLEILQSIVIVVLSAGFWFMYWVATQSGKHAAEALKGWDRALDGWDQAVKKNLEKQQQQEWPDTLNTKGRHGRD